jgi:hypothetical protein
MEEVAHSGGTGAADEGEEVSEGSGLSDGLSVGDSLGSTVRGGGCHDGAESFAGLLVMLFCPLPSAFMT